MPAEPIVFLLVHQFVENIASANGDFEKGMSEGVIRARCRPIDIVLTYRSQMSVELTSAYRGEGSPSAARS